MRRRRRLRRRPNSRSPPATRAPPAATAGSRRIRLRVTRPPDLDQPPDCKQERDAKDADSLRKWLAHPDDHASDRGDDQPFPPGRVRCKARPPGIGLGVVVAPGEDHREGAALEDTNDAVALYMVVADRDLVTDDLAPPHSTDGLGRHDDDVAGVECRHHASG